MNLQYSCAGFFYSVRMGAGIGSSTFSYLTSTETSTGALVSKVVPGRLSGYWTGSASVMEVPSAQGPSFPVN